MLHSKGVCVCVCVCVCRHVFASVKEEVEARLEREKQEPVDGGNPRSSSAPGSQCTL